MGNYYAKFKENPCVGTDASTPFVGFFFFFFACFVVFVRFEGGGGKLLI